MLNDLNISRYPHVYIACGYTDLRKGIDGLVMLINGYFQADPFDHSLFLFCGKRNDRIKAVCYEGDGFVLLYKRIATGRFRWPRSEEELKNLTQEQYDLLMKGWEIEPGIKPFKPELV